MLGILLLSRPSAQMRDDTWMATYPSPQQDIKAYKQVRYCTLVGTAPRKYRYLLGCRIPLAHGVTGAPRGSRWRHLAQRANETPAPLEAVRRVAKASHSGCAVFGCMGCRACAALGRRLRSSAAILLNSSNECLYGAMYGTSYRIWQHH